MVFTKIDVTALSINLHNSLFLFPLHRQLTGLFQFTVRLLTETEARFTSVERITHYIKVGTLLGVERRVDLWHHHQPSEAACYPDMLFFFLPKCDCMCDQYHYTHQSTFSIELHVVVFAPRDWARYESLLLYGCGQTANEPWLVFKCVKPLYPYFYHKEMLVEWKSWSLHLLWDIEIHATCHYGSLSQCLESEAPRQSHDAAAPAPSWPQQGKIAFQGVELRYREELPLVLKNLSFTILPEESIGIVGRTGSGTSDSRNFGYKPLLTLTHFPS